MSTKVSKAIAAVESGMTVRDALKKFKVSIGTYYKAKNSKQSPNVAETISEEDCEVEALEHLEYLYGILSPMTYARALADISTAHKK